MLHVLTVSTRLTTANVDNSVIRHIFHNNSQVDIHLRHGFDTRTSVRDGRLLRSGRWTPNAAVGFMVDLIILFMIEFPA